MDGAIQLHAMSISLSTRIVCALAAIFTTGSPAPTTRLFIRDTPSDSAATAMIAEELHAFYRDLHDHNSTSMVTHFYPAKVTARFAVPATNPVWASLAAPTTRSTPARPDAHGYCSPQSAIVIVGNWARARSRRCTGELDEAWFYRMSARWKIVHLELSTTAFSVGARSIATSHFSPIARTR
jgi:hypothetical protein